MPRRKQKGGRGKAEDKAEALREAVAKAKAKGSPACVADRLDDLLSHLIAQGLPLDPQDVGDWASEVEGLLGEMGDYAGASGKAASVARAHRLHVDAATLQAVSLTEEQFCAALAEAESYRSVALAAGLAGEVQLAGHVKGALLYERAKALPPAHPQRRGLLLQSQQAFQASDEVLDSLHCPDDYAPRKAGVRASQAGLAWDLSGVDGDALHFAMEALKAALECPASEGSIYYAQAFDVVFAVHWAKGDPERIWARLPEWEGGGVALEMRTLMQLVAASAVLQRPTRLPDALRLLRSPKGRPLRKLCDEDEGLERIARLLWLIQGEASKRCSEKSKADLAASWEREGDAWSELASVESLGGRLRPEPAQRPDARLLERARHAYKLFHQIVSSLPDATAEQRRDAATSLALTLRDLGRHQEALVHFRSVEEAERALGSPAEVVASAALDTAVCAADAGLDPKEVVEAFRRAEEAGTEPPTLHWHWARWAEAAGRPEEARLHRDRLPSDDFRPEPLPPFQVSEEALDGVFVEELDGKDSLENPVAQAVAKRGAPLKKNELGETPIQAVINSAKLDAEQTTAEAVRLISAHRGWVNSRDHGAWTALHDAAQNDLPDVVQALVDAGADIDAQGGLTRERKKRPGEENAEVSVGKTAAMRAAESGHLDVLRVLVQAGADLSLQSIQGLTALDYLATYAEEAAAEDAAAAADLLDEMRLRYERSAGLAWLRNTKPKVHLDEEGFMVPETVWREERAERRRRTGEDAMREGLAAVGSKASAHRRRAALHQLDLPPSQPTSSRKRRSSEQPLPPSPTQRVVPVVGDSSSGDEENRPGTSSQRPKAKRSTLSRSSRRSAEPSQPTTSTAAPVEEDSDEDIDSDEAASLQRRPSLDSSQDELPDFLSDQSEDDEPDDDSGDEPNDRLDGEPKDEAEDESSDEWHHMASTTRRIYPD